MEFDELIFGKRSKSIRKYGSESSSFHLEFKRSNSMPTLHKYQNKPETEFKQEDDCFALLRRAEKQRSLKLIKTQKNELI